MADKNKNDKKSFKDTLNLPKTSFDMRAGLLQKEPACQARWAEQKLNEQLLAAGADRKKTFVLHDGPPYANGDIHMGHALNKTLKDMVLRIKNMTGYKVAPMIHGWDCHGQPIEQKIVEKLGEKMHTMPATTIRRLCKEYAEKFVGIQSGQFQRLGVLGDFTQPYITMHPKYEAAVLEVFARLVEQSVVFKQLKPVHWSIENRTALADAELEYHDRKDPSVFVALPVTSDTANQLPNVFDDEKVFLVVWTTTPWTLPANRAVAVHPKLQYEAIYVQVNEITKWKFLVASERIAVVEKILEEHFPGKIAKSSNEDKRYPRQQYKGSYLVEKELRYIHPLIEGMDCPVVEADFVSTEEGTGLVHIAPGHGTDDYFTGLTNGLDIYCPVLPNGTFDETVPEWLRGISVWEGNELVIEHLKAKWWNWDKKTEPPTPLPSLPMLLDIKLITHSYPHDWRSKTPTIFRATEQWFVGVDTPLATTGRSLRDMARDVCGKDNDAGGVNFIPGWGRNRILGMLESRPDWCLSRQRSWGLPIPAFYNEKNQPLCTAASVRAVAKVIGEKGSDAWFDLSPAELLAGYDPAKDEAVENPADFAVKSLTKGFDIFDVWFESGSSWFAVAVSRGLVDEPPVDLYLEGSDQHRGWFQLSLLPCLGAAGVPPFRSVLTHGFVVTEDGHKMSKSLGNAIEPREQLTKRGADILRLWVASQNYQDDVRCSESLIAQAEESYRKIRNTLRFCLGSIDDYDPATETTEPSAHSVDLWMRMELHQLIQAVREAFDRYEFHRATRLMYEFCTVQASSVYMSAVKDRLYCEAPNSARRRATQGVLRDVVVALVKLLAPILPHTAEEAWEHIPHKPTDWPASVHLTQLPEVDAEVMRLIEDIEPVAFDDGTAAGEELRTGPAWVWERLMDIRGDALLKIEALRNAGVKNPLDAEVIFLVPDDKPGVRAFLEQYLAELEDLLGVGYARIEAGDAAEGRLVGIDVRDTREVYARCERSWKRRPDVGADGDYPDLSARDASVMKQLR